MRKIVLLLFAWFIPPTLYAGQLGKEAARAIAESHLVVVERLNPPQLTGDFNGDGKDDRAYFVSDKATGKKGLCVLRADSAQCDVIGAGNKFFAAGDDLNWVKHWSTVDAGKTWETTFKKTGDVHGTKGFTLQHTSIRLCADEGGCGIVSFQGGKYIWVHQAD